MQSIVRNPLAAPEVLGMTQGAGLATFAAHSTLLLTFLLNRSHRYAPLVVAWTGLVLRTLLWTTLSQWLITGQSVQPARFLVWLVGRTYGRSWGRGDDTAAFGVCWHYRCWQCQPSRSICWHSVTRRLRR